MRIQKQTLKEGDKLKYIGKGFLSFDPEVTEMSFLQESGFDYLVKYKGMTVRVRRHEVNKIGQLGDKIRRGIKIAKEIQSNRPD